MREALRVDPRDAAPIWRQIEEGLRRLVASRALPAGSPVPSVRDLARDLRVNPATVSKAYQRLVDAGVLAVRRGEGTFVTDAPPVLRKQARKELLHEPALRFAALALTAGASLEDSVEALSRAWERLQKGMEGGQR